MEKYNKRVPGRISGVLLILLGGLGMAYKILLVWMDILLMQEFQNEELPELARTQMVFYGKRCMSGDFVSDFADMGSS